MKILESISQYVKIDDEIRQFINQFGSEKHLSKGEVLSSHNSVDHNLYFLEKGLLRSFYFENGKDLTANFYKEGNLIANKNTIFLNQSDDNNIDAIEPSLVTYFNYSKLEELCENSLALANFSRRVLGVLLANMEKRVHSLQHMTAKEKYQELLTEHPDILLRAPLGMIASYLGISQETLSRIRSSI
ncbi:Crp/Fnr family transcriptional regulator [Moheibacter lacus]|uniref:Crp/Fnr family transcriptional regulator n=1 Tax=Moheibacter lacus TaxID=2745851 RepID=A0A838ZS41_9FLAO|nr:Crp/Fnr family transcriptional regulator [Moheibacter lacus]MBA5629902.1 Crp/Fnr family transcriptional regulator [Moheibacter lacus]